MKYMKSGAAPEKAEAVIRYGLGILMLLAGIGKFVNGYPEFVEGASQGFADTMLSPALDDAFFNIAQLFLAIVPFAEVILGVFLLVGLYRTYTLFSTGILFVLFIFGMLMRGDTSSANFLFIYLIATAVALSLPGCCCTVVNGKKKKRKK